METFAGYDAWKLSYPPHWDDEPDEDEAQDDDEDDA